jgi:hypothetical protein
MARQHRVRRPLHLLGLPLEVRVGTTPMRGRIAMKAMCSTHARAIARLLASPRDWAKSTTRRSIAGA